MKNKSLEKKLISHIMYNNMNNNISSLDEDIAQPKPKRGRKPTEKVY